MALRMRTGANPAVSFSLLLSLPNGRLTGVLAGLALVTGLAESAWSGERGPMSLVRAFLAAGDAGERPAERLVKEGAPLDGGGGLGFGIALLPCRV